MTPKEKIAKLFHSFTVRYGELELRHGQQRGAVERSWELSVGRYVWDDIALVMKQWFQTAKKSAWPEEGQMLELLRQFDCRPEPVDQHQPAADWREAEELSGFWYNRLIRQPPEKDWWLNDRMACVDALLTRFAAPEGANVPDLFKHRLARAWQAGALRDEAWEMHAAQWRTGAKTLRDDYLQEIRERGIARTNERRMAAWRS